MGWLFACFGYTNNKRKRPRKATKFGSKSRRIRSYQALQSESDATHSHELSNSEPVTVSGSNLNLRAEPKDEKKVRIKKKVRFNLDVIAYEPIPADDVDNNSQDDDFDKNWEENEEDDNDQDETEVGLVYAASLSKPSHSYLSNHRYNNCYEQDDYDLECELSDLDDDEDEDGDDDDCDDDDDNDDEWLINPRKIYHEEIEEEHLKQYLVMNSSEDADQEDVGNGSTKNTRFRSHYVVPVLNPIENLSQWKALKARKC